MIDSNNITTEELHKCLQSIARNESILLQGVLLTDYEFEDILKDLLNKKMEQFFYVHVQAPYVVIKTIEVSSIKPELVKIFNISENDIVDIKYGFTWDYIIDCSKFSVCVGEDNEEKEENRWSPIEFLTLMDAIGRGDVLAQDAVDIDAIIDIITNRFTLYVDDFDFMVAVEFENNVLAIAVNCYVADAKEEFSHLLGISQDLFIEVSGPCSTVMLIDAEKLALLNDKNDIGAEQWLI